MIDVTDVRLGNLIVWNPKLSNPQVTLQPTLVEIAVIAQDKIGYTPYKLEQRVEPFEDDRMIQMETMIKPAIEFEPYILTKEILEKNGFENTNGSYRLAGFYPTLVLNENNWLMVLVPDSIGVEFKYIHQLQNLYYTIVGEELTLSF